MSIRDGNGGSDYCDSRGVTVDGGIDGNEVTVGWDDHGHYDLMVVEMVDKK